MKKIIIVVVILLLILSFVIAYLNKVILPRKLKSFIVTTLKTQTGKDVTLKSLELNIFKGLILRDLVISDTQNVILSTREASCSFFIWPILKKQIIIPGITLKAPYIFLEHRADKSFNLQDLFIPAQKDSKKSDFNVSILKISVLSGNVVFQDDTLSVKFKKEIKNIQLNLYLSLPASLKFNFKGETADNPALIINASGQYKILSRELISSITLKNLSVQEYQAYYNGLEGLVSGLIDLEGQINFKNNLFSAEIKAKGNSLAFVKDKLKAKFNSTLNARVDYGIESKKFGFSGACDISEAGISGIDLVGEIKNLHGKFNFNERTLTTDSLKAELLGMPFEVKLGIKDFSTPVVSLNTDLNLSFLPTIAKDKFNFNLINSASGKGVLSIRAYPDKSGAWVAQGDLKITGAALKLDKQNNPVENISASIEFSQQGVSWKEAEFKYQGKDYQTNGTLVNFSTPNIKLKLFSQDFSLAADFDLLGKKIKVSQLKGKYLDSQFLISGDIDSSDSANLRLDLNGKINFELSNLSKILGEKYPAISPMRLSGLLDTDFNLNGSLADFKNCYLRAKFTGNEISLYGLKAQGLSSDFLLDQKIAKIATLRADFYDGTIESSGALNLDTADFPYQCELTASGIKLEKLKLDTGAKDKNLSGILSGDLKLTGFSNDLNKLSGAGSFSIGQGKLWELNLLQGLGKLLFAKDLGSIELSDCKSYFLIKNKFISTDNLKLKGNVANLYGPLKIGFDGSLEGALSVDILNEMVPLSGTMKDVTTAIIGQAGKFGTINLSGTLAEPKYNFKPAVVNIIKSIADMFFKK